MISINKLTFSKYANLSINIENVSFDDKGLILVEGKNGSGKSTFLELLSGLLSPDQFVLSVDGKPLSPKQVVQFQEEEVFLVHQSSLVFQDLTCLQNILLPFNHPDKEKALSCLKTVGLEKLANQKAGELSSGERQRLGFARSLYDKKRIILLDEVTSNLDSESKGIIESCISELAKECLVIFVTHEENDSLVLNAKAKVLTRDNGTLSKTSAIESDVPTSVRTKKTSLFSSLLKGRKRNPVYYLVLSLVSLVLCCLGGTFTSLNSVFSYSGSNPYRGKVTETTYLNNASVFFYSGHEKPSLKKGEYFYGYHYDFASFSSDIGKDIYDLAYIPSDSSFEEYQIQLAQKEGKTLGRLPVSSEETRVSSYTYQYYSKENPSLNQSELFSLISDQVNSRRMWADDVSVVGVYQGREWTEENEAPIKLRKNGYTVDTEAGTYYYFLQNTMIGIADQAKEGNQEYNGYYLLNTDYNRVFRSKHRNNVHLNALQDKYSDLGGFVLPVTNEGNPAYSEIHWLSTLSFFGPYLLALGALLPLIFRISFLFRNKKKYLLLRSRGYKRKTLVREDTLLHLFILILCSILSFGISELVVYLVNCSFVSSLSNPIAGRNYFGHSYLPPVLTFLFSLVAGLLFFVLDSYVLLPKDTTKQTKELKAK